MAARPTPGLRAPRTGNERLSRGIPARGVIRDRPPVRACYFPDGHAATLASRGAPIARYCAADIFYRERESVAADRFRWETRARPVRSSGWPSHECLEKFVL